MSPVVPSCTSSHRTTSVPEQEIPLVSVMQLVDSLDAGGMERVALNLANELPRERFVPHLCTTRREGVLAEFARSDVGRLNLSRQGNFDLRSILRFLRYVRRNRINLIHAHNT